MYHIAQFQISAFPLSCPSFLGRGVPEAAVNYSLKFLSLISYLPSHLSQTTGFHNLRRVITCI